MEETGATFFANLLTTFTDETYPIFARYAELASHKYGYALICACRMKPPIEGAWADYKNTVPEHRRDSAISRSL